MLNERDKRRLEALIAAVKPSHSIAARLDTLSDDHRDHYDWCKARLDRFIEQHPDGQAYEMYLKGFGPRLPNAIAIALFGPTPHILNTDDENTAMQKYQQWMRT